MTLSNPRKEIEKSLGLISPREIIERRLGLIPPPKNRESTRFDSAFCSSMHHKYTQIMFISLALLKKSFPFSHHYRPILAELVIFTLISGTV